MINVFTISGLPRLLWLVETDCSSKPRILCTFLSQQSREIAVRAIEFYARKKKTVWEPVRFVDCQYNTNCNNCYWCTAYGEVKFVKFVCSIASPKVMLPSVVRALPGYRVSCLATGTSPIYTTMIQNSYTLLVINSSYTPSIPLNKDGNYTCVAINKYGVDVKDFLVIFNGKMLFFKIALMQHWFQAYAWLDRIRLIWTYNMLIKLELKKIF